MKNNIAVIIVTYNDQNMIGNCLESILQSATNVTVIVVDNDSSDNTVEIARSFKSVIVEKSTTNIGFAAANNVGARLADSIGHYQYLFLLNPDTIVGPTVVGALQQFLDENIEYGIVGPMQCDYHDRTLTQLNTWTRSILRFEGTVYASQYIRRLREAPRETPTVRDVPYVQGSAFFCRAEIYWLLFGLNEKYWMYHEEVDFCRRARWIGSRTGLLKNIYINHMARDLADPTFTRVYHRRRNKYYFALTDPALSFRELTLVFCKIGLSDIARAFHRAYVLDLVEIRAIIATVRWLLQNRAEIIDERRIHMRLHESFSNAQ
ncbi:glycosyltransferase family 2 protein [Nocardia sp. NPDC049149]|uniref:glycosyltransferase family 2 protein n=1 Tax=Nocardia sp. NPDC049149 TaxID=3364315 RepID=UPI00371A04E9